MKIIAIGDPHGELESIKKLPFEGIDLILLTGDLGKPDLYRNFAQANHERVNQGLPRIEFAPEREKEAYMEGYSTAIEIMKLLAEKAPVYTIFGNADITRHRGKRISDKIGMPLPYLQDDLNAIDGVKIIDNQKIEFKGVKIGGLSYFIEKSWAQEFIPKDSKKIERSIEQTEIAKEALDNFKDLDILLCHQPPYGVLDKVTRDLSPKYWLGKHGGSRLILNFIKKGQPKYVFCGHIHEAEGEERIWKSEVFNLGVAGHKIIDI